MKLKTITLAIAALGVSSVANAAMYAPECVGENVTVPCEQRGWHVGAQYIYVQPTGDQLYSDLNSQSKWASGFRIEGGYHFGTGNDITANWIYFSKASQRNVVPFNNPFLGSSNFLFATLVPDLSESGSFDQFFGPGPFYSAERVKSTFNAVNLEFGQLAYWGERVSTRFHAGLQYANIKRQRSHYNFALDNTLGFGEGEEAFSQRLQNSGGAAFEQKFHGIGPRLGLDAYYTFGESNFSLVGKGAVAVLAADSKVRKGAGFANYTLSEIRGDVTENLFVENVLITVPDARTRTLTVGLEAKLGIEYAYPLASGDLVFEGGYQWAAYPQALLAPTAVNVADAVEFIDDGTPISLSGSTNLGLGIPGDMNNFGYHGFYVGLRWEGDLA